VNSCTLKKKKAAHVERYSPYLWNGCGKDTLFVQQQWL